MSTYAIGDLQGCFDPFMQLLQKIDFNPGKDTLWLTGDIVNRGPDSLKTLRWVFEHQNCVQMVLGNHDLHLITGAEGYARFKKNDTVQEILDAVDSKILLEFLRVQPLMIADQGYAMTHAGIHPKWSLKKSMRLAVEVEEALQHKNYRKFLERLFGDKPTIWSDELNGIDRLRFIVNTMTRMRFLNTDGSLDFNYKGELEGAPPNLIPWFEFPSEKKRDTPLIVGHWSALGFKQSKSLINIDTGCLWGGSLTAFDLSTQEIHSLSCPTFREIER